MTLSRVGSSKLLGLVVCDVLVQEELPTDLESARSHAELVLEESRSPNDPILELRAGGVDWARFEEYFARRLEFYADSRKFAARNEELAREMKTLLQFRGRTVPVDADSSRSKSRVYARSRSAARTRRTS